MVPVSTQRMLHEGLGVRDDQRPFDGLMCVLQWHIVRRTKEAKVHDQPARVECSLVADDVSDLADLLAIVANDIGAETQIRPAKSFCHHITSRRGSQSVYPPF